MQALIDQIKAELDATEAKLAEAKTAIARVATIEGDIERLRGALKALGAPQSPSGRKHIGDAQRRRKKEPAEEAKHAEALIATPPAGLRCSGCRGGIPVGIAAQECPVEGCDANCCSLECLAEHRGRWHPVLSA